jgi:glucose/arabinose dehydrogenase
MINPSVRGAVAPALALLALAACDDLEEPLAPVDAPAALQVGSVVAGGPAVGLRLIASGLTSPLTLAEPPDGSDRRFVVDQIGLIHIITGEGQMLPTPFLDVRPQMIALTPDFDERGLLGLAFHPDFATNGRFYVYYSVPPRVAGFNVTSRISEFTVSSDPNVADPASERIILEIDKPQFNHNAGRIAFGPDDYLYISIGDGGGADDVGLGHVEDWYTRNPGGNGQDIEQNLLGNILRIDVDGGAPYAIPPDNPFVNAPGLDEIWAYGLRNPYGMSFDMGGDRALYTGDAGQGMWEEVNTIVKGGNYGWNVKEGPACFNATDNTMPFEQCPDEDPFGATLRGPSAVYRNASQPGGLGIVVIGGYVYRGTGVGQLGGRYIFGDFSRSFGTPDGSVFMARPRDGLWVIRELRFPARGGRLGHYVLGFGQDAEGEVYIMTTDMAGPSGTTGRVYQIVQPPGD